MSASLFPAHMSLTISSEDFSGSSQVLVVKVKPPGATLHGQAKGPLLYPAKLPRLFPVTQSTGFLLSQLPLLARTE